LEKFTSTSDPTVASNRVTSNFTRFGTTAMLTFDTFFGAAFCAMLLDAVQSKSAVPTVRTSFVKIGFMRGGNVNDKGLANLIE
jgi:hypothetical protein